MTRAILESSHCRLHQPLQHKELDERQKHNHVHPRLKKEHFHLMTFTLTHDLDLQT